MRRRNCLAALLISFLAHSGFSSFPDANASLLHAQLAPTAAKLNVPAEVMKRHCVTKVTPAYPEAAKRANLQGPVVLRVVITATGGVSPIAVVSGDAVFAPAAMDVVKSWAYNPYVVDGIPAAVSTEVTVDFAPGTPAGVVSHPHPRQPVDQTSQ